MNGSRIILQGRAMNVNQRSPLDRDLDNRGFEVLENSQ